MCLFSSLIMSVKFLAFFSVSFCYGLEGLEGWGDFYLQYRGCSTNGNSSVFCRYIELKVNEPMWTNQSTSEEILIMFVNGSIGIKTLSPFQEAKILKIYSSKIDSIEDGAICSLPKLKTLELEDNLNIPLLTRGTLRGCDKLESMFAEVFPEREAFPELTGLENLYLRVSTPSDFDRGYLETLKNLKTLGLVVSELKRIESGLFCPSPALERLDLSLLSSQVFTEVPFEGCNKSLKTLLIEGGKMAEGASPFKNSPHLERLMIYKAGFPHLTKDYLSGLPNLRHFALGSCKAAVKIDRDAFTDVPHLTTLDINYAELNDSDLEALRPLSNLVNLQLRFNKIKNLELLPALPNLEYLYLDVNLIEKFNLERFKMKVPKLKILFLLENPTVPEFEEELRNEQSIEVTFGPLYPHKQRTNTTFI